jgi:hypothetical protein
MSTPAVRPPVIVLTLFSMSLLVGCGGSSTRPSTQNSGAAPTTIAANLANMDAAGVLLRSSQGRTDR